MLGLSLRMRKKLEYPPGAYLSCETGRDQFHHISYIAYYRRKVGGKLAVELSLAQFRLSFAARRCDKYQKSHVPVHIYFRVDHQNFF